MAGTFIDELARLNQQNFLGGIAEGAQAIKEQKQNTALVDLYNQFRAKTTDLQTKDQQLADLNKMASENIDYKETGATEKFAALLERRTGDLSKLLAQSDAYSNLYAPFITAFATLGEDGVKVANTLSKELNDKKESLEQKSKFSMLAVENEKSKLEYAKAVQDNLMDDFKFDVLRKEYARNTGASQLEGIIRSLPEYNNMPDVANIHSTQKAAVFTKIKNDIRAKALEIAKAQGIEVTPEIADLAFQKTLSDDKKLIYSELKPSDYPIDQQAQGAANYKNTYDMYGRFMETATHMYSNVYNSAPEDEKSLLIRDTLKQLKDANGFVNASKAPQLVKDGVISKEGYDALFNPKDGFYTVFAPGGLYDQAQSWMNQNVYGWDKLTNENGFNRPAIPNTENIMRYKGSGAAINFNGSWTYNPAEIRRNKIKSDVEKRKALEEADKKSMIKRGTYSEDTTPYNWMNLQQYRR